MNKNEFIDRLNSRVLLGDGAMGTLLYQSGAFLNTCFDELNLVNPKLVGKVHESYIRCGCDLIETNSFGANEFKLGKFGLADKVEQINRAAVELAQEAAGRDKVLVAGSVGPLGVPMTPFGRLERDQAFNAFVRQIRTLIESGIDLLMLETFSDPQEILVALDAAAELGDIATVAQLVTNEFQETIYGQKIQDALGMVACHPAVAAVGLNCSVGPSTMLSSLELIRPVTDKPLSLQPNAGLPREVEGRKIYMSTPEYMAEFAKRFLEKGVRIIGGCCGTTPEHIREIIKAVRSVDKATGGVSIKAIRDWGSELTKDRPVGQDPVPLAHRSKFAAKLAKGEKVISVEVTPPRGANLDSILEKARLCHTHDVDAINIPDGPRASSRISPMITAIQIQQEVGMETILHVCCRDRNIIGIQSDMLGAQAIGLRNMLFITGDPPKLGDYPDATAVFDLDAIGLTDVVRGLNRGIDIGGNEFQPPLSLVLGVGANPVASDLEREIERFKLKVKAGAEYAITQPVFDTRSLFAFMDRVADGHIPIIAGIWPFASFKNAEFMANEVPGVVVPENLLERMSLAQTRQDGLKIGVEIAQELIAEIYDRVAGFAISAPFGNVKIPLAVMGKISADQIA